MLIMKMSLFNPQRTIVAKLCLLPVIINLYKGTDLGGGAEYGGSRKLPYFRGGKRKFSAHFSGFEHKNCKRKGNIQRVGKRKLTI